jgi:hypothetical protein
MPITQKVLSKVFVEEILMTKHVTLYHKTFVSLKLLCNFPNHLLFPGVINKENIKKYNMVNMTERLCAAQVEAGNGTGQL